MINHLRPLSDFVVIKLDAEQTHAGRFEIPEAHRRKALEGEVVAVGPGRYDSRRLVATTVRPGERVQFHKHHGTEVEIGGQRHMVVTEDHIHGVISS